MSAHDPSPPAAVGVPGDTLTAAPAAASTPGASAAPTAPPGPVDDERRLRTMLVHALHTCMALLLALAVVRAWQAGEHPVAATAVAAGCGVAYALTRTHHAMFVALLALWAVGCALTSGFAWMAFPLVLLVLHALPRRAALAVVAGICVESVLATGSVVGPVVGVAAAVLAAAIFAEQRRDAQRARALVAQLREAQGSLAATERERAILAERERVGRELHDTVAQGLASIVVLARTADPADAAASLALIEDAARADLAQTRRLVRDLASPGQVSIDAALEALVADTRARAAASGHPLRIELAADGTPHDLDPRAVQALTRGAQASVANVVQHARATRCAVGLSWFDDRVVLDVVDDGCGFDPDAVGDDSFGLRGLRARLAEVGGGVDVDTAPGERTTVALTVPLPPAASAAPVQHPDPEDHR